MLPNIIKMKHILILILVLLNFSSKSQDILQIPADSTSEWRILRGYLYGTCVEYYNSIYYVNGIEEFNNNEYHKIYETGEYYQQTVIPPEPCDETYSYEGEYRASIRTENGKVYTHDGLEEHLLMDFTLNIGDTLNSFISDGLIIGSIDSVLIGNQYRKRYNFSNGDICNWMIEGLGHERGLFEPMHTILEFSSEFICYGENNIPLFGDLGCTLNVGTGEEPISQSNIIVYPNPANSKIQVLIPTHETQINAYMICDIIGEIKLRENIDLPRKSYFEINLESFNSGIYFLILNFENSRTIQRKIIKN